VKFCQRNLLRGRKHGRAFSYLSDAGANRDLARNDSKIRTTELDGGGGGGGTETPRRNGLGEKIMKDFRQTS
jgi:hypothetical protein